MHHMLLKIINQYKLMRIVKCEVDLGIERESSELPTFCAVSLNFANTAKKRPKNR